MPRILYQSASMAQGVMTGLRAQFPGNHGGVNWVRTSFDPRLGYLFASVNELGQMSGLRDHDPKSGPAMASLAPDGSA